MPSLPPHGFLARLDYSINDVKDSLPYIVYAGLVLVAGSIVVLFLTWVLKKIFLRTELKRAYVLFGWKDKKPVYKDRDIGSLLDGFLHGIIRFIMFFGLFLAVWFAAAFVGYNPWQSAATSIVFTAIVYAILQFPFSLIGQSATLDLDASISIGQYWEFGGDYAGMLWRKSNIGYYLLRANLDALKSKKIVAEEIFVPISDWLNQKRKRNYAMEETYNRLPLSITDENATSVDIDALQRLNSEDDNSEKLL